jgi:hypothetical protein
LVGRLLLLLLQGAVGDLESDLRRMMLPHTAAALKESKRNTLKDFVAVAGPLGVSHFLILTATEKASYLRIAKSPRVSGAGIAGKHSSRSSSYHGVNSSTCADSSVRD